MAVKERTDIASAIFRQHYSEKTVDELASQAEALGYSRVPDVGSWRLYVVEQQFFAAGRKEGRKERYAIIQGKAPTEAVQSDLEQMANSMLKGGNWFYTTFVSIRLEDRGSRGMLSGLIVSLPLPIISLIDPKLLPAMVMGWVLGQAGGYAVVKVAGSINDRRITRGLSGHAISYNYGRDAGRAITNEYAQLVQSQKRGELFDAIAAGKLPRHAVVGNPKISVGNGA